MGNEPLLPEHNSQRDEKNAGRSKCLDLLVWILAIAAIIGIVYLGIQLGKEIEAEEELHVPDITIQSMDFTVLNVTDETPINVNWDLLIRIPRDLPASYMCLKGNFQVLILYKGATIATSALERYKVYGRILGTTQQLNISTIASEEDMDGGTVKDIMEAIKNKGEIRFGSQVILPDCRRGTNGKMKYACHEATLQFDSQRSATLSGNYPNCVYIR